MLESMGGVRHDPTPATSMLGDAIDAGLAEAVKDNDSRFPPEWRLSKKGRKQAE